MVDVRETEEFSDWLSALRDARAKAKILVRIARLAAGNPAMFSPLAKVSVSCGSTTDQDTVCTTSRGAPDTSSYWPAETEARRRMTSQRLSGWLHMYQE